MVLIHLCYEYEFAKAQCGKYEQMQQMWLCILSGGQFEDIKKTCSVEKKRDAVNKKVQATNQNVERPGILVKQGCLIVKATWFKQCKLVKPMYLGFQRLLA